MESSSEDSQGAANCEFSGDADETCNLFILRHGETDFNVSGRIQGQLESRLNPHGARKATHIAEWLADRVSRNVWLYSSPLLRTLATAEILANRLDLTVIPDPRLTELGRGVLEGLLKSELAPEYAAHRERFAVAPWTYTVPQGENYTQLYERTKSFVHDHLLTGDHRTNIVVTHGYVIRMLVFILGGESNDIENIRAPHNRVYSAKCPPTPTRVTAINLSSMSNDDRAEQL